MVIDGHGRLWLVGASNRADLTLHFLRHWNRHLNWRISHGTHLGYFYNGKQFDRCYNQSPSLSLPRISSVMRTGAVNAASGSAYTEFGNTKVIVSIGIILIEIFGPRESKKTMMYRDIGRLNCSVSFTTL